MNSITQRLSFNKQASDCKRAYRVKSHTFCFGIQTDFDVRRTKHKCVFCPCTDATPFSSNGFLRKFELRSHRECSARRNVALRRLMQFAELDTHSVLAEQLHFRQ